MALSLVKPIRVIYGIGVQELDTEARVLTIVGFTLFILKRIVVIGAMGGMYANIVLERERG